MALPGSQPGSTSVRRAASYLSAADYKRVQVWRDLPWDDGADPRVVDSPPTWRVPIFAATVAAVAIAALARLDPADVTAPGSVAYGPAIAGPKLSGPTSAPAVAEGAVTTLRTRFAGTAAIEIWGRTTASDGAAIRLQLEPDGVAPIKLPDVPAVAGRFYAKAPLPAQIRGRDVDVRAGIRR